MKKILFTTLLLSTSLFAQWNGTTNKTVRESDLFGPLFDQALDSADIEGGGTNLEPELVVTPTESKIVMDVDSTRINGKVQLGDSVFITKAGRIGIGVKTPGAKLQISFGSIVLGSTTWGLNNYNLIMSGAELNQESYDGGVFTAADVGWLGLRPNSLYTLGGLKTDGQLYVGGDSSIFVGNFYAMGNMVIDGIVTFNDYTFPPTDGSAGTAMKTDGNGNLYWGSDIFGSGSGGSGHADSLTHLGRIIPGDSVVTYADGIIRYQPLDADLTDLADRTIAGDFINTIYPWGDDEVTNSLTVTEPGIANTIARDAEVTKTLLGTNGSISDGTITNGDDNLLPTEDDVYDFVIGRNYLSATQLNDSNYVLTSETSAWDKNASNDVLKSDSTASNGYATRSYSNASYHVGQPGYGSIKDFITDGNQDWNNTYGFITGNQTITLSGDVTGSGATTITTTVGNDSHTHNGTSLVDSVVFSSEVTGDTSDYTITGMDSILNNAKMKWDTTASTGYVTQYDLSQVSGMGDIVDDTTPQLGGDLDLNDKSVVNTTPTFTLTATELSYVDGATSNLQNQISALEDSIQSLNSKFQSILDALEGCCDLSDNTPPDPVTNLVATPKSTTKDSLTWTASGSTDANWYRIYRKTTTRDSTTATKIDSVAFGTNYYVNTGLTENTVYWYWIKVVDDSGNVSGWCVGDSAKTFTSAGATPFATLDFEEGDLSDFTTTSGAGVSATTGSKYSGTYGMNITGASTSYGRVTFTPKNSVYVTFQFYMPEATTCTDGYVFCAFFADSANADRTMWGGQAHVDTTKWVQWIVGPNSGNMSLSSTNFNRNNWHEIKMYYKRGTGANGEHKIWIDGDEAHSTISSTYTERIDRFDIGIMSETLTGNMYVDDIKLYDEDPD